MLSTVCVGLKLVTRLPLILRGAWCPEIQGAAPQAFRVTSYVEVRPAVRTDSSEAYLAGVAGSTSLAKQYSVDHDAARKRVYDAALVEEWRNERSRGNAHLLQG